MRPAPTAVQDLLQAARPGINGPGVPYVSIDCFTFQFVFDNQKAYYNNGQSNITVLPIDGTLTAVTFLANSVKVSGAKMKLKVGVSVDEQEITIDSYEDQQLNGTSWPVAAKWGFFDGAILRRDRFFAQAWGNGPAGSTLWLGGVPMFLGRISTVTIGRQSIKAKVKSFLVLGDIQMPKEFQGPSCKNALYDANCTVSKPSFTATGTVGAGSNAGIINWSSAASGYTFGEIAMVTGANAGVTRAIKQGTPSQLILRYPFQFEPGVGDTFEASFGCDKTATMCDGTFTNNLLGGRNFRAMRFTPPPETGL
jgi:hypothetical protein